MLKGLDISEYQAGLNLSKLSPKPDFVFIRATLGANYKVDPYCDKFYQQAKKLGIKRGVYHYAYPQYNSPEAEANYFVDNCKGYIGDAIFVLDFEETISVAWALAFLKLVEKRIGYKPAIYMNASTERSHNWSSVAKGNYGLWLASWTETEPKPKYWAFNFIWQYTSHGHWKGFANRLDLDQGNLTKSAWDKYAGSTIKYATKTQADALYLKYLGRHIDAKSVNLRTHQTVSQITKDLLASAERKRYLAKLAKQKEANAKPTKKPTPKPPKKPVEKPTKPTKPPVKKPETPAGQPKEKPTDSGADNPPVSKSPEAPVETPKQAPQNWIIRLVLWLISVIFKGRK